MEAVQATLVYAAGKPGPLRTEKGFTPYDWCETCGLGLVAGRVFRDRGQYDLARRADAIMKNWGTQCEQCDIAALTAGTCPVCRKPPIAGSRNTGSPNAGVHAAHVHP